MELIQAAGLLAVWAAILWLLSKPIGALVKLFEWHIPRWRRARRQRKAKP